MSCAGIFPDKGQSLPSLRVFIVFFLYHDLPLNCRGDFIFFTPIPVPQQRAQALPLLLLLCSLLPADIPVGTNLTTVSIACTLYPVPELLHFSLPPPNLLLMDLT